MAAVAGQHLAGNLGSRFLSGFYLASPVAPHVRDVYTVLLSSARAALENTVGPAVPDINIDPGKGDADAGGGSAGGSFDLGPVTVIKVSIFTHNSFYNVLVRFHS